jgi:hypothetical protein
MYKYFTWTDDEGYFRGQQLLGYEQISTLLSHLPSKSEAFATIQDYDAEGNCIGCPLYFDIDSPSLWDAYHEMQELVEDLRAALEAKPLVWFSGSKGFHVVCPIYIRHERCHELVKLMVDDVTDIGDRSVYRSRSMWRCNSTWNSKGEGYKVQVHSNTMLEHMIEMSTNGTHDPHKPSDWGMRDADISAYIPKLPKFEDKIGKIDGDFLEDFRPCMRKLWEMDAPPEGQRHQFLHIMARHCFRSGLSKEEAEQLFATHHFWSTVRERDYTKVIASVYRTGRGLIGCKHGRDAEVLRPHCSLICALNDEFDVFKVLGGKDERVS